MVGDEVPTHVQSTSMLYMTVCTRLDWCDRGVVMSVTDQSLVSLSDSLSSTLYSVSTTLFIRQQNVSILVETNSI